MKIFKNLFKSRVLSAFTMVEIMIGLIIVAVAIIPVIGVMSSSNKSSEHGEATVQAASICRNIMDTLLNDVRFKCLLPGGISYGFVKTKLASDVKAGQTLSASWQSIANINMARGTGSPNILEDKNWTSAPGSTGNIHLICLPTGAGAEDTKYTEGLLHKTGWSASTGGTAAPWTYRDERGTVFYVNVSVRVVPIMFRFLNTTEYSWGAGNISDKATSSTFGWGLSYFPDESEPGAGNIDYVFGDEPVDTGGNHTGTPPLYLQYDVKDARMKKIVVSVFWTERLMKTDVVKSYSLISFKAKLED